MEAILALEDGRVFQGRALGARGEVTGEVVFNTGLTGYQEILTDPSYRGQIVVLTVAHVGNTGINDDDPESTRPQVSGLAVRDAAERSSSWRARVDLGQHLRAHNVVGIAGLDTRALTRHLRTGGVLRGCISSIARDAAQAVERARHAPRLEEQDLVSEVTRGRAATWRDGSSGLLGAGPGPGGKARPRRVVVIDYGVKRNILRLLVDAGFEVTVAPARTNASDILALRPDGVFLSNGPGDPATYSPLVETVNALLGKTPVCGICLGHQLAALALGARTYKLKFGHHGTNHPVREEATRRVAVTSQNHGYAVDEDSLPAGLDVTHRSLYDGTIEGLAHNEVPLFTVQYHPEGAPGPHDSWGLFSAFHELIASGRPMTRFAQS